MLSYFYCPEAANGILFDIEWLSQKKKEGPLWFHNWWISNFDLINLNWFVSLKCTKSNKKINIHLSWENLAAFTQCVNFLAYERTVDWGGKKQFWKRHVLFKPARVTMHHWSGAGFIRFPWSGQTDQYFMRYTCKAFTPLTSDFTEAGAQPHYIYIYSLPSTEWKSSAYRQGKTQTLIATLQRDLDIFTQPQR